MEKRIGKETDLIWYIAYGSNINEARFKEYLEKMTNNPPLPEARPFMIPYSIYFDRSSSRWDSCGVAFLDPTQKGFAYGKAYLLTVSQFYQLQILEGISWYSDIVSLGIFENRPAYTFTQTNHSSRNKPSPRYVQKIFDGLKTTFQDKSSEHLENYLRSKIN
jgi:hypothetical protein